MKQNTYTQNIKPDNIYYFIFILCYLNVRIYIHKLINYFLDKSKLLMSNSISLLSQDLCYLYNYENYILIDSNFIFRWKYL